MLLLCLSSADTSDGRHVWLFVSETDTCDFVQLMKFFKKFTDVRCLCVCQCFVDWSLVCVCVCVCMLCFRPFLINVDEFFMFHCMINFVIFLKFIGNLFKWSCLINGAIEFVWHLGIRYYTFQYLTLFQTILLTELSTFFM